MKARVVIDATFATRDLVFTLNRAPRYRVLVLTEKPARLFEATTNVLTEVTDKPFPMVHKGPGGASKLPGGQGINRSAVRDESHRHFFRKVDERSPQSRRKTPCPWWSWASIATWRFTRKSPKTPTRSSGLWPAATTTRAPAPWASKSGRSSRRERRSGGRVPLVRLSEAVSLNRHASGIDQVWRAAFENRCQTLLVETDFEHPADLSPEGDRLLPYTGRGESGPRRRRRRSDRKSDRPRWRGVFLRARRARSSPADRGGAAVLKCQQRRRAHYCAPCPAIWASRRCAHTPGARANRNASFPGWSSLRDSATSTAMASHWSLPAAPHSQQKFRLLHFLRLISRPAIRLY